jgi:hypothetical protein
MTLVLIPSGFEGTDISQVPPFLKVIQAVPHQEILPYLKTAVVCLQRSYTTRRAV